MSIRYGTQLLNNGTASIPSIRFANSDNTGMYLSSADNLDITTSGVNRLNVSTTAITSTIPHLNPVGSNTAPSYSFTGRTSTGIYSSSADNVDITTSGVVRMSVSNAAVTMTSRPYQILQSYTANTSTLGYLGLAPQASRTVTPADAVRAVSTWTTRSSPTDRWTSVCWAPELRLFCAIAETNRVMTSSDGITWTTRTSVAGNEWYSVCWSAELGLFCAVSTPGSSNQVMTSLDGIDWTTRVAAANNLWTSVCWAPELGLFCAVAQTGSGNRVMTSGNGNTWVTRASPTNNAWHSVCWAPELGLFCAVSWDGSGDQVMTSSDGNTWVTRASPTNNQWYSVCWAPELGLFCAVSWTGSGDQVMTSSDGITWTTRASPNNSWFSVCWAPELGLFCAVSLLDGSGNRVMTSSDGITWTTRSSAAGYLWRSVCWAPELGLFCAVSLTGSGDRVMTSRQRSTYNRLVNNGVITVPSGSATAPSYTFIGRSNTGIYSSATNNIDITTSGVNRLNMSTTRTTITGSLASTGQSVLYLSGNLTSASIPSASARVVAGNGAVTSNLVVFNSVYQQGTEITWVPSTGIITITPVVGGGWFLFNAQLTYTGLATSNTGVIECYLTGPSLREASITYPNMNNARTGAFRINMAAVANVSATSTYTLNVIQSTGSNSVTINGSNVLRTYLSVLRLY